MFDICVNFFSYKPRTLTADALVQNARAAGLVGLAAVGTSLEGSRQSLELSRRHPALVFATAGLHPHGAKDWSKAQSGLKALWQQSDVRMVGECGLDYNRMFSPRDQQIAAFEAHIAAAMALGKPLLLHERDAFQEFISVLETNWSRPRGVVHCFTGGPREAEHYLALGLDLGVTGWVCDERRGGALQDAVRGIPLERLHLETDSPYLTPRSAPKEVSAQRINVPENLRYVADTVAALKRLPVEDVARQCTQNSLQLFGA